MHPILQPLREREGMLLLVLLVLEGREGVELLDYLGVDSGPKVREKAESLLSIDASKRVPFMAREIRQALNQIGNPAITKIDPSWLVQRLEGEPPEVVAALLVTLPDATMRSVFKRLPESTRQALPPKANMAGIDPELLRFLRSRFDSGFDATPQGSYLELSFDTVLQLSRKELLRLLRGLGLIELGQAFVAVGKLALAQLCRRIPRAAAEELIVAVKESSRVDAPDLKQAQRFLARVVVNFNTPEELFQKAGLWRLTKSMLVQDQAYRQAFKHRVPTHIGELFEVYIEKAAEMGLEDEAIRRLQDAIVIRIQKMSQAGGLTAQWAGLTIKLNDPDYLVRLQTAEARVRSERNALQNA